MTQDFNLSIGRHRHSDLLRFETVRSCLKKRKEKQKEIKLQLQTESFCEAREVVGHMMDNRKENGEPMEKYSTCIQPSSSGFFSPPFIPGKP